MPFGKSRALAELPKSLAKTSILFKSWNEFERQVTGLDQQRIALLEQAIQETAPLIRACLLANLASSGLRARTGALARAVTRAQIGLNGRRTGISLRFPSGLSQKLYTYAAALNYGAVRTPKGSPLGGAAKRTLKRVAFGGQGLTAREKSSLERGVRQVHDGRLITRAPFKIGSEKVIPPRPYFYLTASQTARVEAEVNRRYQAKLGLGRKASAA